MAAIWSPAYNDGSYAYAWPPAQRYLAGPSNGYGAPPTLTQVNAGSAHNQIVAEALRWFNILNMTPPTSLVYAQAGQRQSVIAVHDAIQSLYAVMYRAGFPFTNSMQPRTRARLIDVKQLRQALDNPPQNSSTLTPDSNSRVLARRDQPAFGTQYSLTAGGYSASQRIGLYTSGISSWYRYRQYLSFNVPVHTYQYASLSGTPAWIGAGLAAGTLQIRLQPTADSPALTADWGNVGNGTLIGTVTPANSGVQQTFVFNPSLLVPGRENSFALVMDLDLQNNFPYQANQGTTVANVYGGDTVIPITNFIGTGWYPANFGGGGIETPPWSFYLISGTSSALYTTPVVDGPLYYPAAIGQNFTSYWRMSSGWQLNLAY